MNNIQDSFEFSTKLKEIRVEKNLSQKEISKFLSLPVSTYANWEQGRREPNIEMIKKLCEIFDCSADYLLGLSDF